MAEPERARAAWNAFCTQTADIEALDHEDQRFFPLAAAHLQQFFPNLPQGNYLRSVLKHA